MTPPFNPDKPPLESAKRSIEVDMSPAAIDRRMREMFALWDVWQFLRKFRPSTENASAGEEAATGTASTTGAS